MIKNQHVRFVDTVPFEHDAACQRFVAEHPGGATLDEIGRYLGVTRERIRQIEERALRKLATLGELSMFEHDVPNVAVLRQLGGEDLAA